MKYPPTVVSSWHRCYVGRSITNEKPRPVRGGAKRKHVRNGMLWPVESEKQQKK